MSNKPVDLRASGPIDAVVNPEGIHLESFDIRLTGIMGVERALHTANLLVRCAALWERYYRAFVHDEKVTAH